jgi:single-stranded-DNA-specific exonuclease
MEASDASGSIMTLIRFQEEAVFREKLVSATGTGTWDTLCAGYADLPVRMVYYPEINDFRGRRSMQYIAKDIHF